MTWSALLYVSETWTMKKEDIKRLEDFDLWIWRWTEKLIRMELRTKWRAATWTYTNSRRKTIQDWNNSQPAEKMIGPHNERRLPAKNYNQAKSEGEKTRGTRRMMLLDWIMKEGYTVNWMREPDNVTKGDIGRTNQHAGRQRTKTWLYDTYKYVQCTSMYMYVQTIMHKSCINVEISTNTKASFHAS